MLRKYGSQYFPASELYAKAKHVSRLIISVVVILASTIKGTETVEVKVSMAEEHAVGVTSAAWRKVKPIGEREVLKTW